MIGVTRLKAHKLWKSTLDREFDMKIRDRRDNGRFLVGAFLPASRGEPMRIAIVEMIVARPGYM